MGFVRFEDLEVFRLAEQMADDVWDVVNGWNFFARETVGKQFVQAVDSVGANIAEGAGRGTHKDNMRFVRIARGSLNESKYWFRRAHQRNLLEEKRIKKFNDSLEKLGFLINAYLKSIKKNSSVNRPSLSNIKHQTQNTKNTPSKND